MWLYLKKFGWPKRDIKAWNGLCAGSFFILTLEQLFERNERLWSGSLERATDLISNQEMCCNVVLLSDSSLTLLLYVFLYTWKSHRDPISSQEMWSNVVLRSKDSSLTLLLCVFLYRMRTVKLQGYAKRTQCSSRRMTGFASLFCFEVATAETNTTRTT